MSVGENTVVSIRYQMKNGKGEILETNLAGPPVLYLHGAEHMPAFTAKLSGREPGSVTSLYLLQADNPEMLDDDFTFDVIIDGVRPATEEELKTGKAISPAGENKVFCAPGCFC